MLAAMIPTNLATALNGMGALARLLLMPLCLLIFLAGYLAGIAVCSAITALVR